VVELSADVSRAGESAQWVKIATKQSEPMVVRGRSPGHYKDNGRRDSTTSMDPDRGSGASGDIGGGLGSMNGLLGSSRSHPSSMDWESSQRNRNGICGGAYRRREKPNLSPPSEMSEESRSASPTELGSSGQAIQRTDLSYHERVVSRVLHQGGGLFDSVVFEEKDVPRLNFRNCRADLTLPKPSNSSGPLDFGMYGTPSFEMHMVPHSQPVGS
jgi:hypothetical protein